MDKISIRISLFIQSRIKFIFMYFKYNFLYKLIKSIVVDSRGGYNNLIIPMWKNYDILKILLKYRPKRIIEFGSGSSTATFNYYLSTLENDSSCLSFEHNATWFQLLTKKINFDPNHSYIFSDIVYDSNNSRYLKTKDIIELDFIYVDGPPVDDLYNWNSDVLLLLEFQKKPQIIVIDSRYHTVEKIYNHLISNNYRFNIYLSKYFPNSSHMTKNVFHGSDVRHTIIEIN